MSRFGTIRHLLLSDVAHVQAWAPVPIGGLGAITGADISSDGTLEVCRTDVGGCYVRESTATAWTQLGNSFPSYTPMTALTDFYGGTYAIAIAPTAPGTILVAHQGYMFLSTDRGATWSNDSLNGSTGLFMASNASPNRGVANRLKFDPTNANVAYLGTAKNGLWQRLSTGWSQVSTGQIPVSPETSDSYRTTIVGIDPTSSTTGSAPNVRKSVVYCSVNGSGMYKSTDGGGTFALLSGHPGAGSSFRASCMVCDQLGRLWVCLDNGAPSNLYVSVNGGTSWTQITTMTSNNIIGMNVDPKDAHRMVAFDNNAQVMVTVTTPAANGTLSQSAAGSLGAATYYVRITYSSFTGETLPGPETSLAVSANNVLVVGAPPSPPANAVTWNVYVGTSPGSETRQATGRALGSAWTMPTSGLVAGAALPTINNAWRAYGGTQTTAVATNCPVTAQEYASTTAAGSSIPCSVLPHPTQNIDVMLTGFGVYYVNAPWPNPATNKLTFIEDTAGIEELCATFINVLPDGTTFLAGQDRGIVKMNPTPGAYATVNYPDSIASHNLIYGHNVDYAIDNPNFVVCRAIGEGSGDNSAYSTDKGETWTKFATSPTASAGGSIAVGNSTNIVVFPGQNAWPRYSTDGGNTWSVCSFTGFTTITDGNENGWGFSIPTGARRYILCADKQNAGTFYAFNYGPTSNPTKQGVWKSTDGGATWNFVGNPSWNATQKLYLGFSVTLQMQAGHLFICTGPQNNPYNTEGTTSYAYRSEDGGVTWTQLSSSMNDIRYLALGAPKPGASYPYAVYANGWYNHSYGLFRSDDKGATWVSVPLQNWFDWIFCMAGDMSTFGRVVIGYSGTGFAQYN